MKPPRSSLHHYNKIPDSLSANALQSSCADAEQLIDTKKDGIITVDTKARKAP
jgi:hypothetical protein